MLASMPLVVGGGPAPPNQQASVVPTPQQLTLPWERVGETGGVGNSCTGFWKGRPKGDSGGPGSERLSLLAVGWVD